MLNPLAIQVNSGLRVLDNTPVDERYVVSELTDLTTFASNNVYEGLIVYVTATNQTFVLTDVTQYTSINSGWTLIGNSFSVTPSGPIGSLQYRLNAGYTSGSENLLFISSSNTLLLTGSLNHGGGNQTYGNSHAEGGTTRALGSYSHAEGFLTYASGAASHAEGFRTYASGDYSHTEGAYTSASAIYSHAEGYYTLATGESSHAEGYYTTASGNYSHAEGYETKALGEWSHTEGRNVIANNRGTHAEGVDTYAGFLTGVTVGGSGNYAHAEGNGARAVGFASHAEGAYTLASGDYAHAQGVYTTASADAAFAGGLSTRATTLASTAFGKANRTSDGLLIIGNGTNPYSPSDAERSDLAVFKADQIILSQSIYLPDLDLVSVTTGKKFVIINPNTGFLEYSATGPAGSGGGGDITAVTAGNGLSGGGNDGGVTLTLDTGSLHFGKGVSASAAFYGFGGGGTSNLDITNNTNNNIVTATGTNTLNGESNLTFNGSTLAVTGNVTATSFTGSLQGTGSWANNALTASFVTSLSQRVNITGSLVISASSAAHVPTLTILSSGSIDTPITRFLGTNGGMVEIYDRSSGSLFSVNSNTGTAIIDVRSNGQTLIGSNTYQAMYDSVANIALVAPGQALTVPGYLTSSYNAIWFDYVASSGSYSRTGTLSSVWNNTNINYIDTVTTSIGSVPANNISFTASFSNQYVQLIASASTNNWVVKGIIRSI
jgi:hypothetical protein